MIFQRLTPPHVLLLQFFHSTLCPKMSSDQFSLVMSAVFRGWKKLPIYIIYIYIYVGIYEPTRISWHVSCGLNVAVAQMEKRRSGVIEIVLNETILDSPTTGDSTAQS